MDFNFASFFELLIGNINNKNIPFVYYIILSLALVIFFVIKDYALANKEELKENIKEITSNFLVRVLSSLAIGVCCLYMIENLLISGVFGILASIYISNTLLAVANKKKKEDKKEEPSKPSVENNINVVVNNDKEKEEKLIPDFYDPDDLKLPKDITSLSQLNIIMILEMYGYISPNQKFKMITQSLFETPDEQVEKLLKMFVLNEKELKEAKAILNLIKLNNRLISKEEALQCIVDIESHQKGGKDNNETD